jgi:site-specific DNA-methyltransferase (adenine-specific)
MARKPLDGTVAENTLAWGVGGINIEVSRIAGNVPSVPQPKTAGGVFSGKGGRNGDFSSAPNGRWPANVVLDEASAEIVDDQSGVTKSGAAGKNASSGFPGGGYDGDYTVPYGDTGGASRFFYVAKASKRDRNEGLEDLEDGRVGSFNGNVDETPGRKIGANPDRPNLPGKNTHPTVKPTALMRYLIKLVTPEGGVVLDPFTGAGSTGKAALLDGFQFVGVELTEEYLPIIEGRLRWASEQVEQDDDTLF